MYAHLSKQIELSGELFHYLDFGGEGLPPMVFVHGTGFHSWVWVPFGEALCDRFHVYALDQSGHGDSEEAEREEGWIHNGNDIAEFVRKLGLDAPFCVGHSMGATSILFAEGLHPGTFSRGVLVDPIVMLPSYYGEHMDPSMNPMVAKTLKRREVWDSCEQMIESYREKPPFQTWLPEFLELYVRHGTEPANGNGDGQVKLKCRPEFEASIYASGHRHDPRHHLPKVQIPMLVIKPGGSDTARVTVPDEVAESVANGEILEVEGATHYMPMEEPEKLIDIILEFEQRTRPAEV